MMVVTIAPNMVRGLASGVVIIFLLFVFSCKKEQPTPEHEADNQAPAFTLKHVDGRDLSLSDFRGKIVVLDFWATWCHSCKDSSVELERLHKKYGNRGVVILGISMDRGDSAVQMVKDFMNEYDLTYQMVMDDGKVNKDYGVIRIPVTYILDRNHVIVKKYVGALPGLGEKISGEIEKIL
jgi:peroxiredoxin